MRITVTVLPDPTDSSGLTGVIAAIESLAAVGFDRVWFPQLHPAAEAASWDALSILALAGAQIPNIELGTGVTGVYGQHPFVLARAALTASAATSGRLIVGLGASHRYIASDMLGYSYDAPVAYMGEYLDVLNPALAGQPVDHHGQNFTAVGQLTVPQAPVPPVLLAALGPRMLALAGERAGGTITAWTGPRAIEHHVIPRITASAAAAGRPAPQVIVGLPVCVTDNVDLARDALSAAFNPDQQPAYRAILDIEGVDGVADVCVFGDERDVIAKIRRFADIGATEFTAYPVGDAATRARTIELLATL